MSSAPLPQDSPEEKRRRVQALVKQLKGRLVKGSELARNREERIDNGEQGKGFREQRRIRDFYPDAKPVDGSGEGAWVLRSEVPMDGGPLRTGVYLPRAEEFLPHLDISLARVFNLGTDFEGLQKESLAFIDLECTGLMGGTGTYPFLVGVGFFENERFVVEQYFMEDFPDEPAMLGALRSCLKRFDGLVSFNGKTFDAPLLRTRFLMNRMPSPLELPHLDLLHAARRLWRGRLESCSFGSIEREIFGMRRVSDVPGALIPRIYLDYIGGIRRAQIIPVIDHNAQDIVSMASLLALFCKVFREPECALCQHKTDQVGLASWYHRAAQPGEAIRCIERAILLCREPDEEHSLSMHLANLYRRLGRWQDATDIWRERVRVVKGALRLDPCVQLAKYFEHRTKNYAEALVWAERAFAFVEMETNLRDWNSLAGHISAPEPITPSDPAEESPSSEPIIATTDPRKNLLDTLQKRMERLRKKNRTS